jgi:hypothetical protein
MSKIHKVAAAVQSVGRTPKQIAKDGAAVFNAPPTIGLTLVAGKATTDTKKTNDSGDKANGKAVAELFIRFEKETAEKGKMLLKSIFNLSQAGRSAFRVALSQALKDDRDELKLYKGMPEYDLFKSALSTRAVRFSEVKIFSESCDHGFTPNFEDKYHQILGTARVQLRSESSVGPTVHKTRGRKATPVLDKVKNYLLSLSLTVEQLEDVSRMVDTMVKLAKVQQAAMH